MSPIGKPRCLFIVSGEHDTLPQAEICAALEAEGYSYQHHGTWGRVLVLTVEPEGAKKATHRAGLANHSSLVLFESSSNEEDILQSVRTCKFESWIQPGDRFGIKITRVHRETTPIDVEDLQAKIGSLISETMRGKVEVDLTAPDMLFLGVISNDRFFFGPHIASRDREGLSQRRSPLRPFFVPSAINPKIARVMVNLSRATVGKRFLDPFCGTGGLLLEAADIGCIPMGLDIDPAILKGCQLNLEHFEVPFNGTLADARTPPIKTMAIDAIATDPPYGRSSSTKGAAVLSLIQSSLRALAATLKSEGFLCLALPLKHFTEDIIPSDCFTLVEAHTMRIHRSLNRHIVVLQRK
ncbi:MAG: THUMP domain-containing protein [Candidatus Thorarchaeota archaeon]